jgi:hypothetical protein
VKDRWLLLAIEICVVVAVIGLAILAARPGEYAPDAAETAAGAFLSLQADTGGVRRSNSAGRAALSQGGA